MLRTGHAYNTAIAKAEPRYISEGLFPYAFSGMGRDIRGRVYHRIKPWRIPAA